MKIYRLKKIKNLKPFPLVRIINTSLKLTLKRKNIDNFAKISDKLLLSFFTCFFSRLENKERLNMLSKKKKEDRFEKTRILKREKNTPNLYPFLRIPSVYKRKQEVLIYLMRKGETQRIYRQFSIKKFRSFLFQYKSIKFSWSKKIAFPQTKKKK